MKSDELQWENVQVEGTHLGRQDHGIFTASLHLTGDCMSVSFGGRNLTNPKALKHWIGGVLAVCELDCWEQLYKGGIYLRLGSHGIGSRAEAIRPLVRPYPIFWPTDKLAEDSGLIVSQGYDIEGRTAQE